ncbi:MAG: hypothetical protein WKF86_01905 [Acidimicrobiales bacterium]
MSTWRADSESEPQPIGAALDAVAARLGAGSAKGLGSLYDRWEDIVGAAAADHARATSIAHLEATLLRRAGEVVGPGVVRAIEVRVRPR